MVYWVLKRLDLKLEAVFVRGTVMDIVIPCLQNPFIAQPYDKSRFLFLKQ